MDRTEVLIEYGRILQDSADWLDHGYRREHADEDILPPPLPNTAAENRDNRIIAPAPAIEVLPENDMNHSSTLGQIAGEIAACRNCTLYLIRQNTVPGIGALRPTLMIVSSPPSDGAGEKDGPLPLFEHEYLGKWLDALDLRDGIDTFITPAVKCRTPGGRPPHANETAACSGYLRRQYKEIKPRAVLALGAAACGALTGNPSDFPSLVGRDWTWGAVPALVLWTPAEVLANPGRLRGPVWESLQRLKAAWNAVPGNFV